MKQNHKTELERFVTRLKHELTCELNEIKHQRKNILRDKEYKDLYGLECRRLAIKYIRDKLIDEIECEVSS